MGWLRQRRARTPSTGDGPFNVRPAWSTRRTRELDAIVDEMFPALRGDREGAGFLLDPSSLRGSTRDYHEQCLAWLGIDVGILPPERVWIQAGRPYPANLELRVPASGGTGSGKFGLYMDSSLYRSRDAVKMALAHELTHLYLVLHDLQEMRPIPNGATTSLSLDEEIRTEVASMLLGFGKLVINGACSYERVHLSQGVIGQLGYLRTYEFAYLYQLVNALADVPADAAAHGLNVSARELMNRIAVKPPREDG
ncbi:hypothetical protein F8568_016755 [Actinomadura sp. LD22]|uniref:Uncharacterized protein n=1 Tax=Actinomadura physcomitrii TaxID=2650748 RepID=A0A6I4M8H4_9ACTN|nr:hypothetical protein [Actinomadura physcomitrii]MWA01992.1 hypothetical protein [Actinomadura physcomitrii]